MKSSPLHLKIVLIVVLIIVTGAIFHYWSNSRKVYHNSHHYNTNSVSIVQGQRGQTLNTYSGPSQPISDDVIVRSAYFDDRPRNGHDQVGVFLVAMKELIFDSNLLTGCGVGSEVSTNFKIRSLEEDRLMREWLYVHDGKPHFLYEEYIVECYDIPMANGSIAFVLFKIATNSPVYAAISEFPLIFPAPRVQPTGKYDFSVVTCTEAHNNKVTWLQEFIRYQNTIGVDHVHVNILDTFIKDGGLKALLEDPQVAKGVAEGYVTLTVWKDLVEKSNDIYSFAAILRKLDCVYRFRGTYDYAFLLDSDDFFNPVESGKSELKHYIQNWCHDRFAGSCMFSWYHYFPEACGMRNEAAADGNITRLLQSYKWHFNDHFKSVHLISAVIDTGFHHAKCENCLLPGYHVAHVPPHVAYVAHIRMKAKPPNGC